ncbi:MAG: DUF748 domain-containing protein [Methylovulum sp.]|nr:DUF748 domain-containing protein [Methylovulum sp.]
MNIRHVIFITAKTLVISGALLVMMVAVVFLGLPPLLKSKLPEIIQQQTGRASSFSNIQLGMFPLALKLQGFNIKEKNAHPFASFGTLYLQIDPFLSITQTALMIDKVWLDKPYLHIARHQDGTFNFSGLFKSNTKTGKKNGTLFPVTITKLSLSTGQLVWEDRYAGQAITETVTPIQLDIDDFTTRTDAQSRLSLTLALASGGRINWKGTLGVSPFFSKGHIKLDDFRLQKMPMSDIQRHNVQGDVQLDTDYQLGTAKGDVKLSVNKARISARNVQYDVDGRVLKLADFTHDTDLTFLYANNNWQIDADKAEINSHNVRIQEKKMLGKLSELALEATYKVSYADHHLNVIVNQGKLDGKGLQLSEHAKQLVAIPTLALRGIAFNLNGRQLSAASISANDAAVKAWLNADGIINYQALLPVANTQQAPVNTGQQKPPWHIAADSITLNRCSLDFEDQTLPKPFTFHFKPIDFKLAQFSNQADTKLLFQLNAGINKAGKINLSGSATITPLTAATIDIDIKNIDLASYQTYFDRFIRLDIVDGMLAIDGQASIEKRDKLAFIFHGNTGVTEFLTRDQRVHKDFVKWESLSLKDISIDLSANRYTAQTLLIDKPYARVTIRKDKTINFFGLLISGESQPGPAVKKAEAHPAYFKLDKIQVTDGYSDFTDLSLILPFSAHVQGLDGGANGLSSEKNATFNVMLKGNAYDLAPVDVSGKISPYLGDYKVSINFKGLPMPLVSPYMVQFAGYKVEKGKMSLKLDYKIANKQLTAANNLLIDQFELGEKVDNPNAVSLPLKLAVALLKDSSGRIKFDVPITGSLENPQFSLSAIIADALVNAIRKIITSPFNAIASLMGSTKDLSTVSFSPGNSALSTQQEAKLEEVSNALQQRPHLSLEIKGATFQQQDWPAISDDALYDQLKIRRAAEINQKGVIKIRPEYVELSTEDYQRLLADLFIEKFPLLAEKSFLGSPALKAPQTGDFYDAAKQKLLEVINPEQERLKELAAHRAQTIAKYIVQKGGISQERVFILDPVVNPGSGNKEIISVLSLKAD